MNKAHMSLRGPQSHRGDAQNTGYAVRVLGMSGNPMLGIHLSSLSVTCDWSLENP